MHATETFVTMPDGARLFVRAIDPPAGDPPAGDPPAGDPPGPPLLIPNGLVYLDDLAPLAGARRLVAYDLRNRGASDAWPAARGLSDDIEDLERVRLALGLGRAATLGHSYVALIALAHAMRHPGVVDRVVAIGAPPPDAGAAYPPELAYADDVLPAAFAELGRLRQAQGAMAPEAFSRAVWDALRPIYVADPANAPKLRWARPELPNERAFMGYWTAVVEPSIRALRLGPADLAALAAPVLLVHGHKDRSAPLGGARDWAARLPTARLREVPAAAHAPWLEDPAVLPAIAAFLAEGDAR